VGWETETVSRLLGTGPVTPDRAPTRRTLSARLRVVLSLPTLPVQNFSARSTKQALKRIGLLHRSRHCGRDIKVAVVIYPQDNS
jgi:hypothetical protein